MPAWDMNKINQLADKSKKPLEEEVILLGVIESRFVASMMTKVELQKALQSKDKESEMPPKPKESKYSGVKGWYRYESDFGDTLYHLCKRNQQMSSVSEIEIVGSQFGGHQCDSCTASIEWKHTAVDGLYPVARIN